jgi:AraC-like DNA-binding protein
MDHIKKQPTATVPPPTGMTEMCLADPNLLDNVSAWNLDFRQLEPGPIKTRIRVRQGEILNVMEIAMDRAVHQTGLAPPNTVTFGIPLSEGITHWHNQRPTRGGLLSFGATDGFEGVSDSSFHGLTLSISFPEIEALCERLGVPYPTSLASGDVIADPAKHASLPGMTRAAWAYLNGRSPICRNTEEEILANMLLSSTESRLPAGRRPARKQARAVRVALEFMEQTAEDNPPLSQICEAAAVSERTLNRAFNERFEIGPKAYFLRLRLGRVRQDLLRQETPHTISNIANRWGFWHLGQFARDFQKQFGELPSDSSRRSEPRFPM